MAKITLTDFARMKRAGEKIVVVTAYDAPSARLAEAGGVDCILVGDSAAMTVLGHDSTLPITIDEMIMLARAARRGAARPLVVVDMPFGSFQVSDDLAVENAVRLVKETGADAVKLEGAGASLTRAAAIVEAGIPVMGHIGLTPQSATLLGGYKAQGRSAAKADRLVNDAIALQGAGCFSIVLEAMPEPVARRITESVQIPTIGIGAGAACDGQVLVWHDLLGLSVGHTPQFVKRYVEAGDLIRGALERYVADVRGGRFPELRHTYSMAPGELEQFERQV